MILCEILNEFLEIVQNTLTDINVTLVFSISCLQSACFFCVHDGMCV